MFSIHANIERTLNRPSANTDQTNAFSSWLAQLSPALERYLNEKAAVYIRNVCWLIHYCSFAGVESGTLDWWQPIDLGQTQEFFDWNLQFPNVWCFAFGCGCLRFPEQHNRGTLYSLDGARCVLSFCSQSQWYVRHRPGTFPMELDRWSFAHCSWNPLRYFALLLHCLRRIESSRHRSLETTCFRIPGKRQGVCRQ